MNFAALLALLRSKHAYNGDGSPADVKKFVTENLIDLLDGEGKAIDLDALHAKSTKKSTTLVLAGSQKDDDAGDDGDVDHGRKSADSDDDDGDADPDAARKSAVGRAITKHRVVDPSTGGAGNHGIQPLGSRLSAQVKAYNRNVTSMAGTKAAPAFSDGEAALGFGSYIRVLSGKATGLDRDICKALIDGFDTKTATGSSNAAGGALVPDEFRAELIDLQERYGVVKQLCQNVPMSRDVMTVPKFVSGFTVAKAGQAGTLTASDQTFDNVNLTAQKVYILAKMSIELLEDSAINLGEQAAMQMARQLAERIDASILLGDGSSTYYNFEGLFGKFQAIVVAAGGTWATNADYAAGVVVGAGNTFAEITEANLTAMVAQTLDLPGFNSTILCSKQVKSLVFSRLALAKGGVTAAEFAQSQGKSFDGSAIVTCPQMPQRDANSQFIAFYGDFAQAIMVGNRMDLRIDTSDQRYFDEGVFAIRAMQRTAINCHGLGTGNSTEASRVNGAVSGLLSAAS